MATTTVTTEQMSSSTADIPPTTVLRGSRNWSSTVPRSVRPETIPSVAPPWQLTGDVYMFSFWTSGEQAKTLPAHAYSPLEAGSEFATSPSSRPVGGLGMIQILRYNDSPVGPYDEMIVVPGSFDWSRTGADGRPEVGRNPRISRIYVSQKHACYNGRLNWNVPKHLARFEWDFGPNESVTVKVYPHDTSDDVTESAPSSVPFFQASYTPIRFAPTFPFATNWMDYLGQKTTLVMPPLPQGKGSQGELPGTDHWCSLVTNQYSGTTRAGWFDISQRDDQGNLAGEYENFWPGLGRWQLGAKMEDAQLGLDMPIEVWSESTSS